MRVLHCVEYVDDVPKVIHILPKATVGEPGFYREALGLQGFINRNTTFVLASNKKQFVQTRHFHVFVGLEWTQALSFEARAFTPTSGPLALATERTHASITAFFEAIGYQRKVRNINYWQIKVKA